MVHFSNFQEQSHQNVQLLWQNDHHQQHGQTRLRHAHQEDQLRVPKVSSIILRQVRSQEPCGRDSRVRAKV